MKQIFRNIALVFGISCMITSCFKEDLLLPDTENKTGLTLFVASVEDFSSHNVTTKAGNAENEETNIANLSVLLFGEINGTMQLLTQSPLYVTGNELNYVIHTSKNTAEQIIKAELYNIQKPDGAQNINVQGLKTETCKVYIVANMESIIKTLTPNNDGIITEDAFLNKAYTFTPSSSTQANLGDLGSHNIDNTNMKGFPMMGSENFDLNQSYSSAIQVSLKKLFAKVNFKLRVVIDGENNPGDMSNVEIPFFRPISWSVSNVPTSVVLGTEAKNISQTVFSTADITNAFIFGPDSTDGLVEHSRKEDEYVEFSFYMPENKVNPAYGPNSNTPYTYPDKITDDYKQLHKPKLYNPETQYPTYVKIIGMYSDHHGYISKVEYCIYLGQNETDNFDVLRNQELNNIITIKGLKNHDEGLGDVRIDHRVHITSSGYSIAMERETLLDSHFEFRPMNISVQKGKKVVVKIPTVDENEAAINTWFSAELHNDKNADGTIYDKAKPGLRKYFTTDLVESLNNSYKNLTGSNNQNQNEPYVVVDDDKVINFIFVGSEKNEAFKLWFYFDENVSSPYDSDKDNSLTNQLYREGHIYVDYYDNMDSASPKDANRPFTFRQMNLWTINSKEQDEQGNPRQYSIEYFEEYLYNYSSEDNFGVTTDGMEWGLDGVQLSNQFPAILAETDPDKVDGIIEWMEEMGWSQKEFFDDAFKKVETNYDFYLTRDKAPSGAEVRDYSGIHFTKEIVKTAAVDNKTLTLSGDDNNANDGRTCEGPESAVEYCFNKNKRTSNGKVEVIHWYLPAIDETEAILEDGFSFFPVFQSKFYWSSQPAYQAYDYKSNVDAVFGLVDLGNIYGAYYSDDKSRARATKVTPDKTGELSGTKGAIGIHEIGIYRGIFVGTYITSSQRRNYVEADGDLYLKDPYHPGNLPRVGKDAINRVRCAYNAEGIQVN